MIDIKRYKEVFDKFEESSVIANLFNIEEERVKKLIDFGFTFNYAKNYFEADININSMTHKVYVFKSVENNNLVNYRVSFSAIDSKLYKYLIGAYQSFDLYYDITTTYVKLNYYAIFNYIYTVYRLNQKEEIELESFKTFVNNEKELDKENNT